MRRFRFASAVCLLALLAPLSPVAGQDDPAAEPRSFRALRLGPDETIELDGVLTEAAWDRADPAGEFIQQEPTEGGAPTEPTEVYVVYSPDVLYIGAILHDSDPSGILGHQKQRDQGLGGDDRFMWILDTFLDGRTGYFFETNPAGLLGDGLMRASAGFGLSKQWDGIWNVKTARGDYGWSLEIAIPFRTLNFDPSLDTWGINFQRTVRRKQEEMLWSGHRRNQGLFRSIHAGRLTGLEGMSQGLGLEVKPYGATAWREVDEDTEVPADVGFDLNYNLTPSLKAALSVNTDFAETEVDRRRVNLTRFPLFFPEQRDFFLENASLFTFSPVNGINPFFSRTIGLIDGKAVPIIFGSRLTGQAGPYDLGFLQVRTDASGELGAEDLTVGRVKRNFWRQSTVGAIYTRRATGAPGGDELAPIDRHTLGADLDLFTSTFLGDKNLQLESFYVWHNDPDQAGTASTGDRSARGVRFNFPNDIWRAHISYREFGDEFRPAMGFTPRNGFRRAQPTVAWAPRPAWWPAVRQMEFQVFYENLRRLVDNELETERINLTLLQLNFQSGDSFSVRQNNTFERLDRPFEIHDGVVLPVREYRFSHVGIEGRTASQRKVSGNVGFDRGQFWSGNGASINAGISIRPVPGVTVSADLRHVDVDLPEGAFTTDLARVSGAWQASPWVSVTGNVQYDTVSEVVGLFTRLRWILTPGSDFYLVYTQNWQYEPLALRDRFVTLSRGATTKINYTHRF